MHTGLDASWIELSGSSSIKRQRCTTAIDWQSPQPPCDPKSQLRHSSQMGDFVTQFVFKLRGFKTLSVIRALGQNAHWCRSLGSKWRRWPRRPHGTNGVLSQRRPGQPGSAEARPRHKSRPGPGPRAGGPRPAGRGQRGPRRRVAATTGLHHGAGARPRPEPAARDGVGGEAPQGLLDPVGKAVAPRRGQGGAEGGHRGRRGGPGRHGVGGGRGGGGPGGPGRGGRALGTKQRRRRRARRCRRRPGRGDVRPAWGAGAGRGASRGQRRQGGRGVGGPRRRDEGNQAARTPGPHPAGRPPRPQRQPRSPW